MFQQDTLGLLGFRLLLYVFMSLSVGFSSSRAPNTLAKWRNAQLALTHLAVKDEVALIQQSMQQYSEGKDPITDYPKNSFECLVQPRFLIE